MSNSRIQDSGLIDLLDAIYDAAFDSAQWQEVLRASAQLHGCHAGKMGSIGISDGRSTTLGLHGIDREVHDLWEKEFSDQDVWAVAGLQAASRVPEKPTFCGTQLIPTDDLRRTPIYQEIFRRCEVEDGVASVLAWSDDSIEFLACYGGPSREPFDRRARDLHDWIGRHARRSLALGRLLRREQQRSRLFLERLPCAAFVCEADGRIVLHNRQAESILRCGKGLRARRGRLGAQHAEDQDALTRALDGAARSSVGESLAGGATLRVRREVEYAPLSVQVAPIPEDGVGAQVVLEAFVRPVALVLVSDPEARTVLPEEALAAAFGLTPTESRMLAALCAGETPAEYADRQAISRETARFHVKQLLAKTGARRQADLVRMALESVVRLVGRQYEDDGVE